MEDEGEELCAIPPSALAIASRRSREPPARGPAAPVSAVLVGGAAAGKPAAYAAVRRALAAFYRGYPDVDVAGRMATVAAFLRAYFPRFFFVGFYTASAPGEPLRIGPYTGNGHVLACGSIGWGRGVCGAAAAAGAPVVVRDVAAFPGYISCDEDTQSELVVPVFGRAFHDGRRAPEGARAPLIAVLDVDADVVGAFDDEDVAGLEAVLADAFGGRDA